MKTARILIVDSDRSVRNSIRRYLSQKNYVLESAVDKQTALKVFKWFEPHIIVLAVNFPDGSGYELCEKMSRYLNTFVIILSSRSNISDKIEGYSKGADDYITKPFDIQEVEYRIKAILKRHKAIVGSSPKCLKISNLVADPRGKKLKINDRQILLTALEFDLFYFLATQPERVWRRDELIMNVWNHNRKVHENVIDVYVGNIRKKIMAINCCRVPSIQTVRGVGYKLVL